MGISQGDWLLDERVVQNDEQNSQLINGKSDGQDGPLGNVVEQEFVGEKVYQVSELNEAARDLLELGFSRISVEGEISNLSRPSSGHLYFSLKDAQASIACALFKGSRFGLRMNWSEIGNGQQVRVQGRVSLYAPRGQYQLIVSQMEPAGLGALEREYQLRLQRLQAEGVFAAERKREVPSRAMRIGVITSPSAAALQDVLNTLQRRNPAAEVVLYPCMVQGKEAPAQILSALQAANRRQDCEVLLLVRGGGSLEDLWAFNDEALARAIAASGLPIVSGVGHEIDTTLADFAADKRAATPTAAAEMVSPFLAVEVQRLQQRQLQSEQRLARYVQQRQLQFRQAAARLQRQDPRRQIERRQQRADELQSRLQQAMALRLKQARVAQLHWQQRLAAQRPERVLAAQRQVLLQLGQRLAWQAPQRRLQEKAQRLQGLEVALQAQMQRVLRQQRLQLADKMRQLSRLALAPRVQQEQRRLAQLSAALGRGQGQYLQVVQQQFAAAAQRLSLLSPLSVLSRGYAVAQDEQGAVLSSVQAVAIGQKIALRLADGRLQCEVKAKTQSHIR